MDAKTITSNAIETTVDNDAWMEAGIEVVVCAAHVSTLTKKLFERLVATENCCSVFQRFHAFVRMSNRKVCRYDSGFSRMFALCDTFGKFGGDGNLVENRRRPFEGNSRNNLANERFLTKITRPLVIVCLKCGNCFGYHLWLWILSPLESFMLLNEE